MLRSFTIQELYAFDTGHFIADLLKKLIVTILD